MEFLFSSTNYFYWYVGVLANVNMKNFVPGKLIFDRDVIGEWNLLHLVQLSQVKTVACFLPVTPYLLAVETCSSLWRLVFMP